VRAHQKSIVLLCFFASGAAALIDQVVWTRQLIPLLGATMPAVATVLAAFMGGLALGGLVGGRWVDSRRESAVRAYSVLEVLTAILALCLPWAFSQIPSLPLPPLALAFVLVLLPTTLMGATLPILAKAVTDSLEDLGSSVANLYAANTTGAMSGCLGAGYLLIPLLGLMGTLKVAAGLNLLAGLLCWLLAPAQGAPGPGPSALGAPPPRWRTLATAIFALCGVLGLAFEVLWTRALITYLGNSVYSFCSMLFVFLAGLSLGGILMGHLCDRLEHPMRDLALVVAGVGLAGLMARQTVVYLPSMLEAGARLSPGFGVYLLLQVAMAGLILLPQTVLLGCSFPLVARLVTNDLDDLGHNVGKAYFCNTVGGIAGSLLAGFVLMPLLGVQASVIALSLLAVVVGLFVLLFLGARKTAVLVFLALLPLGLGHTPWDRNLLLRGLDTAAMLRQGLAVNHMDEWNPIYYKEGRHATIVVGERQGQRTLSVNGQLQASSLPEDRFIQEALGHLPMLFAEQARSVLVIGMGTGMTSAAVARHSPDSLKLAELEPAVLKAGPLFQEWNAPLWKLPGFQPHLTDGRVFVARGQERFDVITSDPIHPLESAASSLYTVEHFRNCRERLAEGGVMCQWLPLYGLSVDDSRRVMGSFVEVFPNASLWLYYPRRNKGDSLLLASKDGTPLSVRSFEQ
jgi:spermidine synthase